MKKKTICIVALVVIACILLLMSIGNDESESGTKGDCKIDLHVACEANLLFNKYDVKIELNGQEEVLEHGSEADYTFYFDKGKQKLVFSNNEDSSVSTTINLDITGDTKASYTVKCTKDEVQVTANSFKTEASKDTDSDVSSDAEESSDIETTETVTEVTTTETEITEKATESTTEYKSEDLADEDSDEDDENATLLYYVMSAGDYEIYYKIDLDKNCVYKYTTSDSGVMDGVYDSGDLNSGITVIYDKGTDYEWTEQLHWKYEDASATLILNDGAGEYELMRTNKNLVPKDIQ